MKYNSYILIYWNLYNFSPVQVMNWVMIHDNIYGVDENVIRSVGVRKMFNFSCDTIFVFVSSGVN